jgi:carbamoyltransferase
MKILGISCYYHDAAACLVDGGQVVAAAQEERFSRNKHDAGFPERAVRYCLAEGRVGPDELDAVAFYDKPILKFHRILETYLCTAPRGLRPYLEALPVWLRQKLWIPAHIDAALGKCGIDSPVKAYYPEHHESHAASAFFPSPFAEAAVVTLDGVGEWATTTVGVGQGNRLELIKEIRFPHSLGLLYSAFTYFCGFRVNSGEYKLMGLAPYGQPVYADAIRDRLIDVKDDGSFCLNLDYFGYLDRLVMTNERFAELFGGPPRQPETQITRREMDLARSIQQVTEEVVSRIAGFAREQTGKRHLCLAGGVALNCVANGKLLRQGLFDEIWIQPAAGDAGGALGAALAVWHNALGRPRQADGEHDAMRGAFLGPEFSAGTIRQFLDEQGYPYEELERDALIERLADLLVQEKVIGLHQGRMEFGPRALGNRSIIGDPRSPRMQSVMNLKIKFRESFRPFAPACMEERAPEMFEIDRPSPYMLLVADVREQHLVPEAQEVDREDLVRWVNTVRSSVPAITHVDNSARLQSVSRRQNPTFHAIIEAFERRTGCPLVINTSFNVRGEPIVCTPEEAYRCFMRTDMDCLVLWPFLLHKQQQPDWKEHGDWRASLMLD